MQRSRRGSGRRSAQEPSAAPIAASDRPSRPDDNAADALVIERRQSEERMRALAEATGQTVWLASGNGVLQPEWGTWRDDIGWEAETAGEYGWLGAVHRDDRSRMLSEWTDAVAAGRPFDAMCQMRRLDGAFRHVAIHIVPVRERDGSIREWIGTCVEMRPNQPAQDANDLRHTARHPNLRRARHTGVVAGMTSVGSGRRTGGPTRAQAIPDAAHSETAPEGAMAKDLRERLDVAQTAEAQLRGLLETAPDAIVMTNTQGRIMMVNHQTEALFGYERTMLLGQRVESLIPERYRSAHIRHRQVYIGAPRTRAMGVGLDLFGRRQDGSEFPVEISLSAIDVAGGLHILTIIRDVTPHKQTEETLRMLLDATQTAEARFRGLLEAAPDAMVLADRDGHITLVNRQIEAVFGYRRDELLGKPIETLIPTRFRGSHVGHRRKYAEDPHTRPMGVGLKLFGRRKDGAEFPVEVSLSALDSPDGMLVLSAIRDVTERTRTETALRQAEQEVARHASEIEATFEAITDAVVLYDREGRVVDLNAAGRAIFQAASPGMDTSSVRERASRITLHDENGRPLPIERWPSSRILRGETLQHAGAEDVSVRLTDGRDILLHVSGAPIRDSSDTITGGVAIFRDVTERRQLERRAREEAEARLALLQMVIDELPSGIYLVQGRDARLVLANRRAAEAWGATWPRGETMANFLATSGTRIFGVDGRPLPLDELATLRTVRTGQAVRHHQEIMRHPDGTTLPILLNAVVVDRAVLGRTTQEDEEDTRDGGELAALVVLQDVTPLKEAERLKDEFISIAAHELRNPMAALKGFAEMLTTQSVRRMGPELDEWQQEAIDAINQAALRLVELTDDLLDVTRLQAGRLELVSEPSDLVALTRRVAARHQITSDRHSLTVKSTAEYVVAAIDVKRIEQVLTNLLANAIKYSPEGGEIEITVHRDDDSGMARVAVRDDGIGIPEAQQPRIFGRFVRADNARDQGISGTGLGLYLSRELVERHGGHLWFESAEGEGSVFSFTAPLFTDATTDQPAS